MVASDPPTLEQIRWRNTHRFRDETDVLETDVPLPALDASHVAPVQTYLMRELFLTPASDLPKLANAKAEERFDIRLEHEGIIAVDDDVSTAYKYTDFKTLLWKAR